MSEPYDPAIASMMYASEKLCMYGFSHNGEKHEQKGFACQREEHARAAVFS